MKKALNEFLTALTFMSRLPVKIKETSDLKLYFFPLVGVLLGLLVVLAEVLFSYLFSLEITAILLLIFYVYLTGALHLDGLGDFADGFFAGRARKKTAEIMHDSNSGIFALVTLILILGLKYLLFKEILAVENFELLILMAVFSRYLLGFLIVFTNAAESSLMAAAIKKSSRRTDLLFSTLITLSIFLLYFFALNSGFKLFYVLLLSTLFIFILMIYLSKWSQNKLGGLSGDIYGTFIELSEIIFLLVAAVFSSLN